MALSNFHSWQSNTSPILVSFSFDKGMMIRTTPIPRRLPQTGIGSQSDTANICPQYSMTNSESVSLHDIGALFDSFAGQTTSGSLVRILNREMRPIGAGGCRSYGFKHKVKKIPDHGPFLSPFGCHS